MIMHTSTNRFLRTASADVFDWALIWTGILPSLIGIIGNDTDAPLLAGIVIIEMTSLLLLVLAVAVWLTFFQSGDALSVT